MKEVYVLHGRTDWNEDVFDPDGNYFEESPCVEVYDSFDEAKARLRELAIEAYNSLKKMGQVGSSMMILLTKPQKKICLATTI